MRTEPTSMNVIDFYNAHAEVYALRQQRLSTSTLDTFLAHVKPGGHILDYGCGTGDDAAYFHAHQFCVTGIDLAENMLTIARTVCPACTFFRRDIADEQGEYDALWCSAVLQYIPADKLLGTLRALKKVTQGGVYGFTVPKTPSSNTQNATKFSILSNTFSVEDFTTTLVTAGYTVYSMETITLRTEWLCAIACSSSRLMRGGCGGAKRKSNTVCNIRT
jgi:trans-aconitate methyltransferase